MGSEIKHPRSKTMCCLSICFIFIVFLKKIFYLFDLRRYECALLLNKSRGTFVLPVFVGAIKGDVKLLKDTDPLEFERFSTSSQAPFPEMPHARTKGPEAMIKELRFVEFTYFIFFTP